MKSIVKYIMKALPVLMMPVMMACVLDSEMDMSGGEKYKQVVFTVRVPDANPMSRALTDEDENKVESIDVLVFSNESEEFLYISSGVKIGVSEDGIKYNVSLIDMDDVDSYDFWVVANMELSAFTAGASAYEGMSKEKIRQLPEFAISIGEGDVWNVDSGSDAYRNVPMWGVLTDRSLANSSYPVTLIRMFAKVDLRVNDETVDGDFIIHKVYLCNYYPEGYVIPEQDKFSLTGNKVTGASVKGEPVVGLDNAVVYESDGTGFINTIYLFEAPAGNSENLDRSCMILEAEWAPESMVIPPSGLGRRYYRLESGREIGGGVVDYIDILRNYHYDMVINNVSSYGFDTPQEAYDAPGGLDVVTIIGDENENANIIIDHNGYYFKVSHTSMEFHANTSNYQQETFSIETNSVVGWKLEKVTRDQAGFDVVYSYDTWPEDIAAQAARGDQRFWLSNVSPQEGRSSEDRADSKTNLKFTFGVNDTDTQNVAYLHFMHGTSLKYIIRVSQKTMQGVGYTNCMQALMQVARFDYKVEYADDEGGVFIRDRFTHHEVDEHILAEANKDVTEYHLPHRSELMLMWIFDRAFIDDQTGFPYEIPVSSDGLTVSSNTTYWSRSRCVTSNHVDENGKARIAWANMARGKVDCPYELAQSDIGAGNTHKFDDEEGEGRRVRQVRKSNAGKYPYVYSLEGQYHNEGPIIVSRANGKGVGQRAMLMPYENPFGVYEYSAANAVAPILQIKNTNGKDTGRIDDNPNICGNGSDGWRLPTQRELQLIYVFGGMESNGYDGGYESLPMLYGIEGIGDKPSSFQKLGNDNTGKSNRYWTATRASLFKGKVIAHWAISVTGQTLAPTDPNEKGGVRCVRSWYALPESTTEVWQPRQLVQEGQDQEIE